MSTSHTYLMSLRGPPWRQPVFYITTYTMQLTRRIRILSTPLLTSITWGSHDEHSNRQIQHHPITHHATSGVIVAGIGPAKAGNRRSGANPGSVSQKKGYHNCEQKKCLYPGPNGTRCLQEISCATVPEHFVSHGITIKPREMILCQWEECSEKVVRHNFVRHVREKHLGHVRGSATRNSKKERGCCAFNTGSVEAETSR
ncbi:hypothetical protein EDD17DRAFT_1654883 [Pisolithus thermaeus]|nr:hypothetical protein EDD17DRAFT_1654883 [Pisolithus thermaeus]